MHSNKSKAATPPARTTSQFPWGGIILVGGLAFLAHAWGLMNDFIVNYDDSLYILDNSAVRNGLSVDGLVYAFTKTCAANWHPLTMLSHLMDVTFFHLWAPGHHAVSIFLHVCNSVLVLLVLDRMTGSTARSAAVALLFAVHPIHVESVAHVAQRKDVLCGLFFLLTLLAYARYARTNAWGPYLLVILFAVLALLAKPVAVTLPFVLLLLDYWPLERIGNRAEWKRLALEKIPIFAIVGVLSAVTFLVQRATGAVQSSDFFPLSLRFSNAAIAYVAYIGKAILPIGLSPFYAMPQAIPVWKTLLAVVSLLLITVGAVATGRRFPWFIVGWLWFLGTLVPMIGLIQVGSQSMADRYAYLTFIGLYIISVWGASTVLARFRAGASIAVLAAVVLLLLPLTVAQTMYWRNAQSLWTRALELDPSNHKAHGNLAMLRIDEGDFEAALIHQLETVKAFPSSSYYDLLGATYFNLGRISEAKATFQHALDIRPNNPSAAYNLGVCYAAEHQPDEAERIFDTIQGKTAGFYLTTAEVLLKYGYAERAMARLEKAKEIDPDWPGLNQAFQRANAALTRATAVPGT